MDHFYDTFMVLYWTFDNPILHYTDMSGLDKFKTSDHLCSTKGQKSLLHCIYVSLKNPEDFQLYVAQHSLHVTCCLNSKNLE